MSNFAVPSCDGAQVHWADPGSVPLRLRPADRQTEQLLLAADWSLQQVVSEFIPHSPPSYLLNIHYIFFCFTSSILNCKKVLKGPLTSVSPATCWWEMWSIPTLRFSVLTALLLTCPCVHWNITGSEASQLYTEMGDKIHIIICSGYEAILRLQATLVKRSQQDGLFSTKSLSTKHTCVMYST